MRRQLPLFLLIMAWILPVEASRAETLRFGLREAAPLVEPGPDGKLRGLEFELLTAIMTEAGMQILPYVGSNARLALAAEEGVVEGFAPVVGTTPPGISLSDSYITYQNVAVTLASSKIQLNSVSDLRGLRILAFQRASLVLGPYFAAAVTLANDYREEPVQALQAKGLLYGRYDVLIGDQRILRYNLLQVMAASGDTSRDPPIVEHFLFDPNDYRAGFRNPSHAARFNEALAKLKVDGTYAAIVRRYEVTQ